MDDVTVDVVTPNVTTTLQVVEGMPQVVETEFRPAPQPSDAFKAALKDGWTLTHGVFQLREQKAGCALGAVRHGMAVLGLAGPADPYQDGYAFYQQIYAAFPQMKEKRGGHHVFDTAQRLEQLFEGDRYDAEQCLQFLTDRGM